MLTKTEREKVKRWIKKYPVGVEREWLFEDSGMTLPTRLESEGREACFEKG